MNGKKLRITSKSLRKIENIDFCNFEIFILLIDYSKKKRKAGIDMLSDHGFTETEIGQISHNQSSVLFKNYMCQLPRRPCLALAGWMPGEEFELRGRRLIKLPSSLSLGQWTDTVFPYRQEWIQATSTATFHFI